MTHDEAIKAINSNMPTKGTYTILTEALELAIEALEKQIAKRPIGMSISHEGRLGNCPCCKKLVHELYDIVGCSECLQRLNWKKEYQNPYEEKRHPVNPPTCGASVTNIDFIFEDFFKGEQR